MNLTTNQKRIIERVVNVFETGSPDGDYSRIAIFNDGPKNIAQITYGRSQTTEYSNLGQLVKDYVNANGSLSAALKPYAAVVGSKPLTDDDTFKNLLRRAGTEDPVMKRVQDSFFEARYFSPAMKWADQQGFTLPLSMLVIYDSYIHSGSIPWAIRRAFTESPPAQGGDEKLWIEDYVDARHQYLANHQRPVVRRTVYRTECFMNQIEKDNWNLSTLPITANGIDVFP